MDAISSSTELSVSSGFDPIEDFRDPMGDQQEREIQQPQQELSEHAQTLADGIQGQPEAATGTKKRAYFWIKAKDGDEAFHSEKMTREREFNMEILQRVGYEVVAFRTNRAFLDHIKADPSKVDLLVISDHGTPYQIGDLWVRGENIICKDQGLTEEERTNGFQSLRSIMNEDSILLFDACLTGNKTIERNIAKVASEVLPQTTVYASQHVTECEPGFIFKGDKDDKPVIDTIVYGNSKEGDTMTSIVDPTIYRGGKEMTGQAPIEIPPELFARRRSNGCNPYVVGAVVAGTIAAAIGIGLWYYNSMNQAS